MKYPTQMPIVAGHELRQAGHAAPAARRGDLGDANGDVGQEGALAEDELAASREVARSTGLPQTQRPQEGHTCRLSHESSPSTSTRMAPGTPGSPFVGQTAQNSLGLEGRADGFEERRIPKADWNRTRRAREGRICRWFLVHLPILEIVEGIMHQVPTQRR